MAMSRLSRRSVKLFRNYYAYEERSLHSIGQKDTGISNRSANIANDYKQGLVGPELHQTRGVTALDADAAYQQIDLSFNDGKEAFKSKTNSELIRALAVFNMCSFQSIVEHNKSILKACRAVLGKMLFEKMMKATFYGQFVAGEDPKRIEPVVNRNKRFGVKSILDYSVEKDLSREEAETAEMESCVSDAQPTNLEEGPDPEQIKFRAHAAFADRRDHVTGARTYFYEDEKVCDENMQHFLDGIDAVSGATKATGFAAVKLTALGRPQLLLQLSEVLTRVRKFYDILMSMEPHANGAIKQTDMERHLKSFILDKEQRKHWISLLDVGKDGEIDLLDWHNLLEVNINLASILKVPNLQTGCFEPLATAFTSEEADCFKRMLQRIDAVVSYSKEKDVRVMIDAEQTYFQTAINRLCMEMMRKYNKDKAIVFNTYQCYLKDAYSNITTDLALSKREDFYFGAKLVRGAYMEQERQRAESLGYEDPINPDFEATTAMYEKVLDECMKRITSRQKGRIAIMVASHNEGTVRYTVEKMHEYGVHSTDRLICFGQLLGMCDQVSFSLGQAGYSVYKYVPYGPVEEVIPYLSRRALENRGMLDKVKKEKRLLQSELLRRVKSFDIFYKPPVPEHLPPNVLPPPKY